MGVRIIEDREDGSAVLYCSTTMRAFGPVFEDRDEVEAFLEWYDRGTDLRLLSDARMEEVVSRFRLGREEWEAEKAAAEEAAWQAEIAEWEDLTGKTYEG